METKLEKSINKEAKNISKVYGIRYIEAQIILLKGVTLYQDSLIRRD
jgi:hypothetical protein